MHAGELMFGELVQRVHETVATALAHADVAQMQVIAELARQQHLLAFNAIPYQVWAPTIMPDLLSTPSSCSLVPCIKVATSSSAAYGRAGKEPAVRVGGGRGGLACNFGARA